MHIIAEFIFKSCFDWKPNFVRVEKVYKNTWKSKFKLAKKKWKEILTERTSSLMSFRLIAGFPRRLFHYLSLSTVLYISPTIEFYFRVA